MCLLRSADSDSEHVRVLGALDSCPENLRSELLKSYGRGAVADYHRNLLQAVEIWRHNGLWRVPFPEA